MKSLVHNIKLLTFQIKWLFWILEHNDMLVKANELKEINLFLFTLYIIFIIIKLKTYFYFYF